MAPNRIMSSFYFTRIERMTNIVIVFGNMKDIKMKFKCEISHVSNMPMDDVHPSCIILPYRDKFYIVKSEWSPLTREDTRESIEFRYSEYIPDVVYMVMCGMVGTYI
jgi:hypothetical protein